MNFEIKTDENSCDVGKTAKELGLTRVGDILKVQKQEFQLLGKFPFRFSTPNYALEHLQLSLLI